MGFNCHLFYAFLILFDSILIISGGESSYTVQVPAGQVDCFWQIVNDDKHAGMEIDYMVVDGGGDYDISFYIKNPHGVIVAQDSKRSENVRKIDVSINKGDYEICFDNSFSFQASKTVFFEIILEDKNGSSDDIAYGNIAIKVQQIAIAIEEFRETATKIKNNLNNAEKFQTQLRSLELRDRSIMESNFELINFWSMLHLSIMLAVGLLQVFMLRSLFEENSRVGKVIRQ